MLVGTACEGFISCRARVRRGTRWGLLHWYASLGDLIGDDFRVTGDGSVLNAKKVSVVKAPQQAVVATQQ